MSQTNKILVLYSGTFSYYVMAEDEAEAEARVRDGFDLAKASARLKMTAESGGTWGCSANVAGVMTYSASESAGCQTSLSGGWQMSDSLVNGGAIRDYALSATGYSWQTSWHQENMAQLLSRLEANRANTAARRPMGTG